MKKTLTSFITTCLTFIIVLSSLTACKNENGENGENGLSAYETYQKYHPEYTGTESEWLETLKGGDGENGLSAYETYQKYHPEYTGTESEWMNALANGELSSSNLYTLRFNTYGGTEIPAQSVKYGGKVARPENPQKEGYRFNGWKYKGNGWVFHGYSVSEDMTFDAQWSIINTPSYLILMDPYPSAFDIFLLPLDSTAYGDPKIAKLELLRTADSELMKEVTFSEEEENPQSYSFSNLSKYDGDGRYKLIVKWQYDSNGDGVRDTWSSRDVSSCLLVIDDPDESKTSVENGLLSYEFRTLVHKENMVTSVAVCLYEGTTMIESLALTGKETVTNYSSLYDYFDYKVTFTTALKPEKKYFVRLNFTFRNYANSLHSYFTEEIYRTVFL